MDLSQYASGAAGSPPAAPATPDAGYPSNGNPGTGTPATVPGEYWFYQMQAELDNVLSEGGITPDHEVLTQLVSAIFGLIVAWFSNNDGGGWFKLPNGLIIQYGGAVSNASGVATFTHPVAFPTAGNRAWVINQTGGLAAHIVSVGAVTTTTTTGYICDTSATGVNGASLQFLVIGN